MSHITLLISQYYIKNQNSNNINDIDYITDLKEIRECYLAATIKVQKSLITF